MLSLDSVGVSVVSLELSLAVLVSRAFLTAFFVSAMD